MYRLHEMVVAVVVIAMVVVVVVVVVSLVDVVPCGVADELHRDTQKKHMESLTCSPSSSQASDSHRRQELVLLDSLPLQPARRNREESNERTCGRDGWWVRGR